MFQINLFLRGLGTLSLVFTLFFMGLIFFPDLFPDFVVYAVTPNNMDAGSMTNYFEMDKAEVDLTPHFPNSSQKEAAQLAGHALYWAFVGFSVAFSACGLIWFYSGASQC